MSVSLAGKTAIVTGAAVGLGEAYAQALAQEGVNVAVCDIREEILERPRELERLGIRALARIADVSNPDQVRAFVDETVAVLGGIDILINNAGKCRITRADDDLDKSLDDYEEMVGTNLKGEFLVGRAVMDQLLKQARGGEIVNVSTDHQFTCGSPFEQCPKLETCPWADAPRPTGGGEVLDIYDASKWGLNGLLYSWAPALRPFGIRVNNMCMGATDSLMIRSFYGFPQVPGEETAAQRAEIDTWMTRAQSAQVVIDLLKEGPEGRTGHNINLCMGRPPKLEPPLPLLYLTPEDLNGVS